MHSNTFIHEFRLQTAFNRTGIKAARKSAVMRKTECIGYAS